jgi:hypothetical protein
VVGLIKKEAFEKIVVLVSFLECLEKGVNLNSEIESGLIHAKYKNPQLKQPWR